MPNDSFHATAPLSHEYNNVESEVAIARDISWPLNRPIKRGDPFLHIDEDSTRHDASGDSTPSISSNGSYASLAAILHPSNFPDGPKSLSAISLRAFFLGVSLGLNSSLSLYFLSLHPQSPLSSIASSHNDMKQISIPYTPFTITEHSLHHLWRPPFFLFSLSVFHFLEYNITALSNPIQANLSAFLLTNNGIAYTLAHSLALVETTFTSLFFPHYQSHISSPFTITLGLLCMTVGQTVRSVGMYQCGPNFNHTVQTRKRSGHQLVTHGLYVWIRHPSYFGFFWWGVGTQLAICNLLGTVGYIVVLLRFFRKRIRSEERFLGEFFGEEWERYRKRVKWVGIPFVQP